MSEFKPKTLCISGRLPALSIAELEALYGHEHIQPLPHAVLLDIEPEEISFSRLGGTLKLARVLHILDTTKWAELEKHLIENIPPHLKHVPEGTFTLGLSVYGLNVSIKTISASLMKVKKRVRATGRSMRVVPNKSPDLNSAQVLHNRLTTKGAWELLLVPSKGQTILAQTLFVQDIEAYAARDQARPKRDPKVGMLPPKLAQTIINLATGPIEHIQHTQRLGRAASLAGRQAGALCVLDPFCGSGVILQEAALMGFDVVGTDNDPRMVSFAQTNLDWLKGKKPDLQTRVEIGLADATSEKWQAKFDAVASEIYLGKPLLTLLRPDELGNITREVDSLLGRFLKNIGPQIKKGTVLSLAVPAWRLAGGKTHQLPVLDKLTDMGYNYLDFKHVARPELVYFRQNQIVARQLVRISKD